MNYNDQEKIMGMVKNLATTLGIPIVTLSTGRFEEIN